MDVMKPYQAGATYPKDDFATRVEAEAWATWADQFLDPRDCHVIEPAGERWRVVQDLKK